MAIIFAGINTVLLVLTLFFLRRIAFFLKRIEKNVETPVVSVPNEIEQPSNDVTHLTEENLIPSDVKFEVEGGDSIMPPSYGYG